jgi:hypothetical protein
LLSGLVITLTFANAVDAGSLTYTVDVDSLTQAGFLPQFNPTMGQLVSVDVVANVTASAEFLEDPPISGSVFIQAFVDLLWFSPKEQEFAFFPLSGFETVNFPNPVPSIFAQVNIKRDFSFGTDPDFIGTGTINVQVVPNIDAPGEFPPFPHGGPSAGGTLLGTYTFATAPEPSSFVMAATGAIVLLGVGCRRGFRSIV